MADVAPDGAITHTNSVCRLNREFPIRRLFDSSFDRVGDFAVYPQRDADFAAPGQRSRQPNIALIQTDKIALRSGKQDFGVRYALLWLSAFC